MKLNAFFIINFLWLIASFMSILNADNFHIFIALTCDDALVW